MPIAEQIMKNRKHKLPISGIKDCYYYTLCRNRKDKKKEYYEQNCIHNSISYMKWSISLKPKMSKNSLKIK